jgi:hypothetical protein
MSQTFYQDNLLKYAIGKQVDIAIASGMDASSANFFVSLMEFTFPPAQETFAVEDNEGNLSTNVKQIVDLNKYPFSFKGAMDVDKFAYFLLFTGGVVSSLQDGATGAWTNTVTIRNNAIAPWFTIFYNAGARGYRRLKGCQIGELTVESNENGVVTFSGNGLALDDDDTLNSTTEVTGFQVTDINYQTASGLIRYQLDTTDLSTVENGDILDTSAASGITNSSNVGKFVIVNVSDTSDYVEVINPNRTDATDDETSLTATGSVITIITDPAYADQTNLLVKSDSSVKDAVNQAGLAAADCQGLGNFTFTLNRNLKYIHEQCKSSKPLTIISGGLTSEATFTQILNTTNEANARAYEAGQGTERAWEFDVEDTNSFLGSSVSVRPRLEIIVPNALGLGSIVNSHTVDEIRLDWGIATSKQQSINFVLQNETDMSSL